MLPFLNRLWDSRLIVRANEESEAIECDTSLDNWEFHDLLFHSRSRLGRHDAHYGKIRGKLGKAFRAPPSGKQSGGQVIQLAIPSGIGRSSPDFFSVLEARKTVRTHGPQVIPLDDLSRFLFYSAGVHAKDGSEYLQRRFCSSGGACYELELYIAFSKGQVLNTGLYHYAVQEHSLQEIPVATELFRLLLSDAAAHIGHSSSWEPAVLLIVTARFEKILLRYGSVGYSLILKNVGALFQNMYLVATALNLAPCAVGGGDSDLFAHILGTEVSVETSVGEFVLGTR